ncbi:MAG: response regulator, partial [Chitinivibrionales bacterium]|nr:response regulator [Chitinivibrionales bacterium]MBD3396703.1 response regulator [Chitinivibrionales bacterium]
MSVSDTGIGMDEETKSRVFEPFFTTKEVGKGTGLGLASVYGTVKQHEGYITLDTAPGQGSIFSIYLPVWKAEDEVSGNTDKFLPPVRGSGTILMADDEELVLDSATDMLREMGYTVVPHADPGEALAYYASHWREIDAVILDIIMPRMSGLDCFRKMKEINPEAVVLLASGYSDDLQEETAMEEGAKEFVQKPYTVSQLSRAVARAMAHRAKQR